MSMINTNPIKLKKQFDKYNIDTNFTIYFTKIPPKIKGIKKFLYSTTYKLKILIPITS